LSKAGIEVTPAAVHYEDVAKSQTAQVLGSSGAVGDFLSHLLVVPETTGAGTIALLDGSVSRNVFVAGTLGDLTPFPIPIMANSVNGAWKVTTGDNVHVIAVGRFT
jgi:hypothetical protein